MFDNRIELSPTTINGYEIIKCIARGSSALCYLAKKQSNGSTYIIKELYPIALQMYLVRDGNKLVDSSDFNDSVNEFISRAKVKFQNETKLSRELRDFQGQSRFKGNNPYFFAVDEFFTVENSISYYACYSTQRGETLFEYISNINESRLNINVIFQYVRLLSYALNEIHNAGYLHLDVKPDNIFVVDYKSPVLKLIDLGSSMRLSSFHNLDENINDTIKSFTYNERYSSPKVRSIIRKIREQECLVGYVDEMEIVHIQEEILILIKQLDASDDFYSLFVILYELLTGKVTGDFDPDLISNSKYLFFLDEEIKKSLVDFISLGILSTEFANFRDISFRLESFTNSIKSNEIDLPLLLSTIISNSQNHLKKTSSTILKDFDAEIIGRVIIESNTYCQELSYNQPIEAYIHLTNRGYPNWNAQICADGGYGKTVLANLMCKYLATREDDIYPIPIFIPLRLFNALSLESTRKRLFILDYIRNHYINGFLISDEKMMQLMSFRLNQTKPTFCIFLDGFDEVNKDENTLFLREEIKHLQLLPSIQVIVISRKDEYLHQSLDTTITKISISELKGEQVSNYLLKEGIFEQLNSSLFQLLRIPLFLIMYVRSSKAVILHNLLKDEFYEFIENPKTEAEIFKNFLEYNLFKSQTDKFDSQRMAINILKFRFIYPYLGYAYNINNLYQRNKHELRWLIYAFFLETNIVEAIKVKYKYFEMFHFNNNVVKSKLYQFMFKNGISSKFQISHILPSKVSIVNALITNFWIFLKVFFFTFFSFKNGKSFDNLVDRILNEILDDYFIVNNSNSSYQFSRDIYRDIFAALWIFVKIDISFKENEGLFSIPEIATNLMSTQVCYHLGSLNKLYNVSLNTKIQTNGKLYELLKFSRDYFKRNDIGALLTYENNQYVQWNKSLDIFAELTIIDSQNIKLKLIKLFIYDSFLFTRHMYPGAMNFTKLIYTLYEQKQISMEDFKRQYQSFFPNYATLNANIIRTINYSKGCISNEDFSFLDLSRLNLSELNFLCSKDKTKNNLTKFDGSYLNLDRQTFDIDYPAKTVVNRFSDRPIKYEQLRFVFRFDEEFVYFCIGNSLFAYNLRENGIFWVFNDQKYNSSDLVKNTSRQLSICDSKHIAQFEVRAFEINVESNMVYVILNKSIVVLDSQTGNLIRNFQDILDPIIGDNEILFNSIKIYVCKEIINIFYKNVVYVFNSSGLQTEIRTGRELNKDYYFRDSKPFNNDLYLIPEHKSLVEYKSSRENIDFSRYSKISNSKSNNDTPTGKVFGDGNSIILNGTYSQSKNWIILETELSIQIYNYRTLDKIADIRGTSPKIIDIRIIQNGQYLFASISNSINLILDKNMKVINRLSENEKIITNGSATILNDFAIYYSSRQNSKKINFPNLETEEIIVSRFGDPTFLYNKQNKHLFVAAAEKDRLHIYKFEQNKMLPIPIIDVQKHSISSTMNEYPQLVRTIDRFIITECADLIYMSIYRNRQSQFVNRDAIMQDLKEADTVKSLDYHDYSSQVGEIKITHISGTSEIKGSIQLSSLDFLTDISVYYFGSVNTFSECRMIYNLKNNSILVYGDYIYGLIEIELNSWKIIKQFTCMHIIEIQLDQSGEFIVLVSNIHLDEMKTDSLSEFDRTQTYSSNQIEEMIKYYNMNMILLESLAIFDFNIRNSSFKNMVIPISSEVRMRLDNGTNRFE